MAGTTSLSQQPTIQIDVTRDEYNELVYSLSLAAGSAAQHASRSLPSAFPKVTREQQRFNHLLTLQSKMMAWGNFLTNIPLSAESPPGGRSLTAVG